MNQSEGSLPPNLGPTDSQLEQLRSVFAGFSVASSIAGSAKAQGFVCRDAVLANFVNWNKPLEGRLPFMYTDVKGLVTTGVGNLIDPIGAAKGLDWRIGDTTAAPAPDNARAATADEVTAAWNTVKGAYPGTQSSKCASLTNVRLTEAGISALVVSKLKTNDAYVAAHLAPYADLPADAQLAVMSMAWAMGPGFLSTFKNLVTALQGSPPDFGAAVAQCKINATGNPGVIPRNTADQVLFGNAAKVQAGQGNPNVLYFLNDVTGGPSGGGGGGIASTATGWLGLIVGMLALGGLTAAGAAYFHKELSKGVRAPAAGGAHA